MKIYPNGDVVHFKWAKDDSISPVSQINFKRYVILENSKKGINI